MAALDKTQVLHQAIEAAKNSQYGVTAIKVELEAQLNRGRGSDGGCSYCDSGLVHCEVSGCMDDGTIDCETCHGEGEVDGQECTVCEYEGYNDCDCDEGYVNCMDCGGTGLSDSDGEDFSNTVDCYDFLMEKLSHHGLAEHREETRYQAHGGYQTNWYPVHPLAYADFYRDGSVDSELTFTLMLDDPANAELLPKFIEAWNDLAEATGNHRELAGSGMHMAFLSDPDGYYEQRSVSDAYQAQAFVNFRRSVTPLLPALYFLAAQNETTRGLSYRRPAISALGIQSQESKYSTIFYTHGALEFRVFDTCYDNPEIILDNLVVMCNTMKYWRLQYKPSIKDVGQIRFGLDGGGSLEQLYLAEDHLDLLSKGLKLIKPAYYTVTELKQARQFKLTKSSIKAKLKQETKKAKAAYIEYLERTRWHERYIYNQRLASLFQDMELGHGRRPEGVSEEELIATADADARRRAASQTNPDTESTFIRKHLEKYQETSRGQYVVRAEV